MARISRIITIFLSRNIYCTVDVIGLTAGKMYMGHNMSVYLVNFIESLTAGSFGGCIASYRFSYIVLTLPNVKWSSADRWTST